MKVTTIAQVLGQYFPQRHRQLFIKYFKDPGKQVEVYTKHDGVSYKDYGPIAVSIHEITQHWYLDGHCVIQVSVEANDFGDGHYRQVVQKTQDAR